MTISPAGKGAHSIICTACGAANAPGSRFCERCGTRLPQPRARGGLPTQTTPIPGATTDDTRPSAPPPEPAAPSESPVQQPIIEEQRSEPVQAIAPDTTAPAPPAAPTMTFALPAPGVPADAARDTPTQTFDLPPEARPPAAPSAPATTAPITSAMAPIPLPVAPPAEEQPTQIDPGWNYRSWTPPATGQSASAGEAAPPMPPQAPEGAATPPYAAAPQATDQPTMTTPPIPGRTPPQSAGRYGPPTTAPLAYPPVSGASDTASPGAGLPYPLPNTIPSAPAGYMPNAGGYAAPASGNSNKTLWIILGVIGGLALICALLCVLVVIVAAASASGTSGVATSVATATRR